MLDKNKTFVQKDQKMGEITNFRLKIKLFLCVLAITLCATSGFQFKPKKEKGIRTPLKYDQEKVESQIQELCSTVCNQYSEKYLQLTKDLDSVNEVEVQTAQAEYVSCLLRCTSFLETELKSFE
ncbi:hypothetical protein T4B_3077 [Trichinella pseudospiralis]|uniref:Uncharacterized protein n=1 Tax=Trichinella pseudospiralis TaxID=6337 RepID=A0A0V1ETV5_TRIPS|nr:hypothetical protein T4A_9870 [Trichinella pseudospiralis]KRZ24498.1 hypothetical protein T4B_3077 [Trichinella pseudospiralis]